MDVCDSGNLRVPATGVSIDSAHLAHVFTFLLSSLGMGNRLIICSIKGSTEPDAQVLVRLLGGNLLPKDAPIRTIDESTETLIFYAIGQQGQGPALYASIPGGRIEEFIPSRRITMDEWINSPEMNVTIARVVANFHLLTIPISKVPWDFRSRVKRCLEQFNERKSELEAKGCLDDVAKLNTFPFDQELEFVEKLFKKVPSRVVFASNDLNRSNFLLLQDASGKDKQPLEVKAIDYEFCAYNFRGCDIGNYFAMKVYDFGSETMLTGHQYPSIEYRKNFIETYVDQIQKHPKCPENWDGNKNDSVEHILIESLIGTLVTRLIDVAWTLRDIDLWQDVVKERKEEFRINQLADFYFERKSELISNYPHLTEDES